MYVFYYISVSYLNADDISDYSWLRLRKTNLTGSINQIERGAAGQPWRPLSYIFTSTLIILPF